MGRETWLFSLKASAGSLPTGVVALMKTFKPAGENSLLLPPSQRLEVIPRVVDISEQPR